MACVYWIHKNEHTDIMSQGYVGITKFNFKVRAHAHKSDAKRGSQNPVHRAIRKYGWGGLSKKILCIGSIEYCREIEIKLRSQPNIGWNIGVGGGSAFLGRKHSEDSRKKMSNSTKGLKKSDEARINIGLAQKGKIASEQAKENMKAAAKLRVLKHGFSDTHKANISKARKGVPTNKLKWLAPRAKPTVWLVAEEIYAAHISGKKRIKILGISVHDVCRMRKHFRAGWNPMNDLEYQLWKKKHQH